MFAQSTEVAITLGQIAGAIGGISIAVNTFFLKGLMSEFRDMKQVQSQHAVDIAVLKVKTEKE